MIYFLLGISMTINLVIVASFIVFYQMKKEKKDSKILSRSTSDFADFWS